MRRVARPLIHLRSCILVAAVGHLRNPTGSYLTFVANHCCQAEHFSMLHRVGDDLEGQLVW